MTTIIWIWVGIAAAFAVLEMSVPFFGLSLVTTSALVAVVAAYFGAGAIVQCALFAVALVLQLTLVRSRVVRWLEAGIRPMESRTQAMIGTEGRVVQAADDDRPARAHFASQDWAVQSSEDLPVGALVEATGIDGIIVNVRRK